MTKQTAEQNKSPERLQASTQSNCFTAIYTDQNHESMSDETLIATIYDDRWESIFLTTPEMYDLLAEINHASLVAALWHFVENSGTTEEFFDLRCRVREHGALYDSAPALLKALETLMNEAIPKANRFLLDMLPPEKRAIYDDCLAAI